MRYGVGIACLVLGCTAPETKTVAPAPPAGPTVEAAHTFLTTAEEQLRQLAVRSNRASWVQANFITHDTELMAAEASEAIISAGVDSALMAATYEGLALSPEDARKLTLLKRALTMPAPKDPAKTAELTRIATSLESTYGKGKWCQQVGGKQTCLALGELEDILAESRDPKRLVDVWAGWRTISPPMRADYQRLVELLNEGARGLGYSDIGTMWRSKYDMEPQAFAAELERVWGQVKPLYDALHCYVRQKLNKQYGDSVVPKEGPMPAHVLGNMWGQQWGNIYPLVAPKTATPTIDLTARLKDKKIDAKELVRIGERFFSSLGFAPLPDTFWERSLFVKPQDRDVVCHASAWDVEDGNDLRIKMCIKVNDEDFYTVHHELGHNYYQRAYTHLPFLFRDSANDGFHEAVGDAVALSVTPKYLVQIGLIDKEPPESGDIALLLKQALDKVAFLPFGLLVDQWRWKVFSGEIGADGYNKGWWDLVRTYQGIVPPVARDESQFDPGAKYHVPANVPYARYFLSHVLQFQFHRSLCELAGSTGPLHRCSIYGNAAAGEKLRAMLAMGQSQPWPEALAALGAGRDIDASAVIDYFAPLKTWLDAENKGATCGW